MCISLSLSIYIYICIHYLSNAGALQRWRKMQQAQLAVLDKTVMP